jgi:hypothetical protein
LNTDTKERHQTDASESRTKPCTGDPESYLTADCN